jgi:hypothetical protein
MEALKLVSGNFCQDFEHFVAGILSLELLKAGYNPGNLGFGLRFLILQFPKRLVESEKFQS